MTLTLAQASPSIFTLNGEGWGPGAIINEDGTVNTPSNPAPRGSVIAIYGNGGGLTNPALPDGAIATSLGTITPGWWYLAGVIAVTGGEPLYEGPAPFLVNGANQMNIRIPMTAPTGPRVPIQRGVNGGGFYIYSQSGVTVAIK